MEAATSRLEDIAVHQQNPLKNAGGSAAPNNGIVAAAAAPTNSATQYEQPPALEAWDETIAPKVQSFRELSLEIGGNVAEQVSTLLSITASSFAQSRSCTVNTCRGLFQLCSRLD